MLGWIIAIIVGALIGWLASKVMGTDSQQGAIANIAVGIIGSALGRWVFGDLLGIGSAQAAGGFSLAGLAFGIIGAVVLIWILKLVGVFK
ncbi:membrane protein [Jeongeupia sp. HS-3]|uniref:GlsB/YeaQ/YmgE family stress response membrane protein n=1 Tax=Jeongeupia sp. HS-3 TaxID=1009682 RepID=UPI0018A534EF|nr:GlsB/YeaQ/YmgE family stress response membrane protein [Jeongeupia sp. HS-3]BCL76452.1 membrane protein [Jeongeupia sp. HS-3]